MLRIVREPAARGRVPLLLTALLLLAGCAPPAVVLPEHAAVELRAVPFFPQDAHQCGPAALATVLAYAGVPVTPEGLTPEVYIPGRQGSLQPELLAATRRAGRIPFVIGGTPAALLAEIDGGNPVLVLQNLALPQFPWWHYAVVVGYDPAASEIILRSGRERARRESTGTFFRAWNLAENWAFVAVAPGQVPASAGTDAWLHSLLEAGPLLPPAAVDAAYEATLRHWPDDPLVLFAAGNYFYAQGDSARAEGLYRDLLRREPRQVAGHNNLANLLLARGCRSAALREARLAGALAVDDPAFSAAVADTLREIEAAPPTTSSAHECPAD